MKKPPKLTKNGIVDRRRPPDYKKFKKGVSGNPLGRPRNRFTSILQRVDEIINAPMQVTENGVRMSLTERQIRTKRLAYSISRGETRACKELLRVLKSKKGSKHEFSAIEIVVIPDPKKKPEE